MKTGERGANRPNLVLKKKELDVVLKDDIETVAKNQHVTASIVVEGRT